MPGTLPLRQYDVVIADIDGCLASEGQKAFDLARLAAVAEHNRLAVENGDRPLVTVCSGRPQPFAESICRMIGNLLVPCVAEMGVWTYHPGTNRYEMDPAIRAEHLDAVHALAAWCAAEFAPKGVSQQPGKNASVTLWHPDTVFLKSLQPKVQAECDRRGWPFRVTSTWYYINCELTHVSKGSGLDRVVKELKIPRDRLAGIGDTVGDRCIADRVAFFACPSNAHPAIKEHAHYISPYAEAEGVVDILARLR
ncbi:MAG TPA: HAD hydrolase family protein [Phycisphaerales bacterium]|nr:HAD hydrolase family protein [Phycisphaerales bacterium]